MALPNKAIAISTVRHPSVWGAIVTGLLWKAADMLIPSNPHNAIILILVAISIFALFVFWDFISSKRRSSKAPSTIVTILGFGFIVIVLVVSATRLQLPQPQPNQGKPDVHIYLVAQNSSIPYGQDAKIKLTTLKWPEGISAIPYVDFPIKVFEWNYPPNTTMYTLVIKNRGNKISKNIKIDLRFNSHTVDIQRVDLENVKGLSILQGGGSHSSFGVFSLDSIMPGVVQDFQILTTGHDIDSFTGWSEDQGDIKMVYIIGMSYEPIP